MFLRPASFGEVEERMYRDSEKHLELANKLEKTQEHLNTIRCDACRGGEGICRTTILHLSSLLLEPGPSVLPNLFCAPLS